MPPVDPAARTVTSKEAHRNWKLVTDKALRAPVVITAHGRPRHVLMAYLAYRNYGDSCNNPQSLLISSNFGVEGLLQLLSN